LNNVGLPRIVYKDELSGNQKYAEYDGSAWLIQTVDTGDEAGEFCSLAVDTDDKPHVVYCINPGFKDLKYGYFNGVSWDLHVLDSEGSVGFYTSIAINSEGNPYISYYDMKNDDLKYAQYSCSQWSIEVVDTAGDVGQYTSVGIDHNNEPHISYCDNTNEDLKYAYRTSRGWIIETIDEFGSVGQRTSLALDSMSYPHICYNDSLYYGLTYAFFDGSNWNFEYVDYWGGVGDRSLILDSEDRPHVAYSGVRYAWKENDSWAIEEVPFSGWYPYSPPSLSLLSNEEPIVCFRYRHGSFPNESGIMYAHRMDTGWSTAGICNYYADSAPAMAIDYEDDIHVGYRFYHSGLMVTEKTTSGLSSELIYEGSVSHISLALDDSDNPQLSFFSGRLEDLMYAKRLSPHLNLEVHMDNAQLVLHWSSCEEATGYWIYGCSNDPWFQPGFDVHFDYRLAVLPSTADSWQSPNGVGNPLINWTYMVIAVDETHSEIIRSNRVGEWDWDMDLSNPVE